MSDIEIYPVKTPQDWNSFYQLPFLIYKDDPVHVHEVTSMIKEELDPKKNPVYNFCNSEAYIALKDGRISGRAVAIYNRHLSDTLGRPTGLVGYFECIDDLEVAQSLIQTCAAWCKKYEVEDILLNVNFSLNYQAGVMIDGFECPHTFLMPHNPPYYGRLFEQAGYEVVKRLHAYKIDLTRQRNTPEQIKQRAEKLRKDGFIVRPMNKKDIFVCLEDYNSTWKDNFAHTEFTREELHHLQKSMKLFLNLNYCFVVEKDGDLCGYLFTFPDFNVKIKEWLGKITLTNVLRFIWTFKIRKSIVGLKTAIIGVTGKYRGRQISALLNEELMRVALNSPCRYIERSWILEDNIASIKQATRLGGELYKIWSLYSVKV